MRVLSSRVQGRVFEDCTVSACYQGEEIDVEGRTEKEGHCVQSAGNDQREQTPSAEPQVALKQIRLLRGATAWSLLKLTPDAFLADDQCNTKSLGLTLLRLFLSSVRWASRSRAACTPR